MAKWGTPEDEQQAIINKLIEDDFLNERRYATAFARTNLVQSMGGHKDFICTKIKRNKQRQYSRRLISHR